MGSVPQELGTTILDKNDVWKKEVGVLFLS